MIFIKDMVYFWKRYEMAYERIINRIAFIKTNLSLLEKLIPSNIELYINNQTIQLAIERLLQIIIEAIMDICIQLVGYFNLGIPNSETNILDLLEEKIPSVDKLRELKKLRNVLVHQYIKIEPQKIFDHASKFPDDMKIILHEINKLI